MTKNKITTGLFLLLAMFAFRTTYAQVVTGVITNSKGAFPGVTIIEKGTRNGTVSDFNGNYTIEVSNSDAILIFSYLGFETMEIPVADKTTIDVIMKESVSQLDELIVTGYKSQTKSTITGAVASVNMDELASRRVPSLAQALQGQVAGVNITQSTGAPGAGIQVRIRGNGTFGNNNPLYIIDGIPSRDISFLNPSDIKSLTVLKDAASAAIYGSRAAGGVIVIETKNGSDRTGIQIDYYRGIQKVTNLPTMLNTKQYMKTVEKAWDNAGYPGVNPYTGDIGRSDFADVDYLDELFELGKIHNLQLSVSGGNDKTNYFLSAGYYGNNGIVVYDNDKFQRINLRANINANLTERFKVGTNIQISYQNQDKISSRGDAPGIIRHAFLRPPIIPVFKDPSDPTYSEDDPFTDLPFYVDPNTYESNKYEWSQNPIALAYFTDDATKTYKNFGNIFAEYSFLADHALKFRTNFGANISFVHHKAFHQNFGDDDGQGPKIDEGLGRQNRPSSLSESRGQNMTFTWNNTVTFDREFGYHSIGALLGMEFIKNSSSGISASRQRFDFSQPNFRYLDFGGTEQDLWNGGLAAEWALFSYFGSINYSFKSKYLFAATLRADASSRFSDKNQWGYFPSISAGWRLGQEDFLSDVDWISHLKLRASWGELGNQEIPNYAYLTLYQRSGGRYVISRYGNPDLTWETTTQGDIGLDFGFFENQLSGSFDYFHKITSDILLPISLPHMVGDVSATYINSGEVKNTGLEFSLTYKNYNHPVKFEVSGNIASLHNEVVSLHPNLPYISGLATRTQAGHPLNAYYGFVQEGIYQNEAEIQKHLFNTLNPPQKPGDIKFKDLDNNGAINDKDRTFIGNPNPELIYGLNVVMKYKSFDFNLFFQGVEGVDRYNDLKKILDYDTRPFNHTVRVLNAWDGEGSTNTIPRVSFTDNGGSKVSDIFVEDASYLRLKNIEFGYTFDETKLGTMRLYVSGHNVLTFANYTGLDPESTDLIDYGTYPLSMAILCGITLNF